MPIARWRARPRQRRTRPDREERPAMLPAELDAAAQLAGDVLGGMVATVRDTHAAIARRAFAASGEGAVPVRLAHDAIAALAYGATGLAGRSLLRGAGRAASLA